MTIPNRAESAWKYACCTTLRRKAGKHYLDQFRVLPERAKFSEISDLFLIPGNVVSDFEHIFEDNFDRVPFEFIKKELSPVDEFVKFLASHEDIYEVREFILNDQECLSRISDAFEKIVKQAIRRWNWNYKTAVPMYFPTKKKIQFLLPLYFSGNMKLDAALVIDKTERPKEYRGVTILTPSMAYLDARLLCKPDSDWLNLDKVECLPISNGTVTDNKILKNVSSTKDKMILSENLPVSEPKEVKSNESTKIKCTITTPIEKKPDSSHNQSNDKDSCGMTRNKIAVKLIKPSISKPVECIESKDKKSLGPVHKIVKLICKKS